MSKRNTYKAMLAAKQADAREAVIAAAKAWMLARMALIEAREQGGQEEIHEAEVQVANFEYALHMAVAKLRELEAK